MKKEFADPLAKHKLYAFFIVLAIGTGVLFATAAAGAQQFLVSFGQGLGTSFVAVALVELTPEGVRRLHERRIRRRLRRFFGENGVKASFSLVSAERIVRPEHLKYLYAPGAPRDARDKRSETMTALPEGVRSWLAEQDIRAASYISKLFGRENIGLELKIDTDEDRDLTHVSLIALGLGFNRCTVSLSELFNPPLFKIQFRQHAELGRTDGLVLNGRNIEPDEHDIAHGVDFAFIARIVGKAGSGYVQFVCAGRSANGTAVAGRFLADNWQLLASQYDSEEEMDTHSLAVVIEHRTADADAVHLDGTGSITWKFGIAKAEVS